MLGNKALITSCSDALIKTIFKLVSFCIIGLSRGLSHGVLQEVTTCTRAVVSVGAGVTTDFQKD